jgi:hypothetical protein
MLGVYKMYDDDPEFLQGSSNFKGCVTTAIIRVQPYSLYFVCVCGVGLL